MAALGGRLLCVGCVVAAVGGVPLPAAAQEGPPSAELTVREIVGTGSESRILVLRALGRQPTKETVLVDASGRHQVTAEPLKAADQRCAGEDERVTGLGTSYWCFQLDGVAAGNEVKGKLAGRRSVVVLTVKARHGWELPAAVVGASLIAAIVLVWLTSRWLPGVASSSLLWASLRNEGGIANLKSWANDASRGRLAKSGVLARVRWAKQHGKRQLLASRADLGAKLVPLPESPLKAEAQSEASRSEAVDVKDLLTPGGARATSNAERLLALVERALTAIGAFREISAALLERIPADDANRPGAVDLIEQQKDRPTGYLSSFTLADVERGFTEALAQLQRYVHDADGGPEIGVALEEGLEVPVPTGAQLRSVAAIAARATLAIGAVLLAAGVLMLVAAVTILATQYVPDETFGTGTDYLTLAAATLGSSAAAGTLAILLLLRGPEDWYG